jgi:hypothetical protein
MATSNRTAREVIDKAIEENKFAERLLYMLSTVSALVGLFVVVWSALHAQPVAALAGSVCTALFWPAMRLARQTRKESIALRLLEAPLSKATTATAAAEMLQQFFLEMFRDEKGQTVVRRSVRAKPQSVTGATNV